ncbi:hypothetical protein J4210_03880 [Candidatus Woesearchaeota archaeon]|nr:hypothetical protein [Candidatus Woesearchaeota archaeon]
MIELNTPDIVGSADELARRVQEYSQSQEKSWRRIPYLALKADHRCGVLNTLATAYNKGLWGVGEKERGLYLMYVDLATGIIADPDKSLRRKVIAPARREEILLLASDLDKIDAGKIAANLESRAKQLCLDDSPANDVWRDQIRVRLNLSEMYVRPADWSYR